MQCTFSTSTTCIKLFLLPFLISSNIWAKLYFHRLLVSYFFLFTFSHWLSVSNVKPFYPSFFPSTSCIKIFSLYFFIDYLYQCSSPCLPWRLEPTPELAHLYSDQCQGFARTISTRLYYGCLFSFFFCVLCDYVKGGRAGLIQKSIRYSYW